jgi:hypothetical protein
MTTMTTSTKDRIRGHTDIVSFAPALERRRTRAAFFRLHGEWINPYRDGIDSLWIGPMNAQIIPLATAHRSVR